MKIAFYSTILDYPWGGADALWTAAAEESLQRGYRVLLAIGPKTAAGEKVQQLVRNGAQLALHRSLGRWQSIGLRIGRKALKLLEFPDPRISALKRFNPDLLVVSSGGTYDLLYEQQLLKVVNQFQLPLRLICNLQYEHPYLSEADRKQFVKVLTLCRQVFFLSQRNLEVTRDHLIESLENAEVTYTPLRFTKTTMPTWPQLSVPTFAMVSRLDVAHKGLDTALLAIVQALGTSREWILNIYGVGPDLSYLQVLTEHLGIGGKVQFSGFVNDLERIWSMNHMLISAAFYEGMPMTIPEAMLHARPVLATDVGAAAEWIEDGVSGYLCPAPTLKLLTMSLQRAWNEHSRWEEMGKAAFERARKQYRPEDYKKLID